MVLYNFLNQSICGELNSQELRENYTKILSVLLPIVPHYASECLNDLNDNIFQNWPQIDKKMLQEDYVEYVVQINGKKRAMITTKKNSYIWDDNELLKFNKTTQSYKKILQAKNTPLYLECKEFIKIISAKNYSVDSAILAKKISSLILKIPK